VFVRIAVEVARREDVLIACRDSELAGRVRMLLRAAGGDLARVHLHAVPTQDTWARDHGPITILRRDLPLLLDFGFNGWGGKFAADQDDQISRRLHALGAFDHAPIARIDLVLEGGSIETDGAGTLLTTRQCLLSATRSGLSEAEITAQLTALFGLERVLWLGHGHLEGDDTDGHIDTLARFTDAATIAYQGCDDPADPHFAGLQAMAGELAALRTLGGAPYRLVPLPWPRARFSAEGERLPASYANFLIINDAVLVPTYDDPADAQALAALAACFPGREVVGIDCLPVIEQYGSLHCLTMQLPQPLSLGPGTA
ncbi:MAG TPA: agmatine deiminase family protein, partial [Nannocystis sp.]|jgi:agmatine deiminase